MCDENSRAHDRALKDTGYFFLLSHDLRYRNVFFTFHVSSFYWYTKFYRNNCKTIIKQYLS